MRQGEPAREVDDDTVKLAGNGHLRAQPLVVAGDEDPRGSGHGLRPMTIALGFEGGGWREAELVGTCFLLLQRFLAAARATNTRLEEDFLPTADVESRPRDLLQKAAVSPTKLSGSVQAR